MNPTQNKLRYQLTFEGSWPKAVAFVGARRVAAGNQVGQIYIWDLPETPPALPADVKDRQAPNVAPVRRLDGPKNEISRLLLTPDGKTLISAGYDRTIRLWALDAPAAGTAEAILDADARQRKARGGNKTPPAPGVTVETQTACHVLEGHRDWITALGISRDGKRLISGDAKSQVIVWDLAERKIIKQWSGHPWNVIMAAALSADGETALVSEYRFKNDDFDIQAPALKLWNVADATEKLDILKVQFPKMNPMERSYGSAQLWRKFVANGLLGAAFSPDGKFVTVGQGGETGGPANVYLIDTATGKLTRTLPGHTSQFTGVTDALFSNDGNFLITAGRDTCARVWQMSDGKEVAVLGTGRGGQSKDWFSAVSVSPDEHALAAADIGGLVQVWDIG